MPSIRAARPGVMRTAAAGVILAMAGMTADRLAAQSEEVVRDEYRVTLFPAHPLSKTVTGFAYLGYVSNPDTDGKSYYLGFPGLSWRPKPFMELWGGLIGVWNENENSADTFELRPFFGPKFAIPGGPVTPFIWPRFEYRSITNKDTDVTDAYWRIRVRIGYELPLTNKKYEPGAIYGLMDVEPYYRFDDNYTDQLRWRMGLGYVASHKVRLELQYYMQFNRADGEALHHSANIFRLNIKVGSKHGLLGRVFGFDE